MFDRKIEDAGNKVNTVWLKLKVIRSSHIGISVIKQYVNVKCMFFIFLTKLEVRYIKRRNSGEYHQIMTAL